ncbi:MAG: radical SAM protein [Chloroflexi bacterium]|nr:radical SAM protein [Chloroflexota bacterium]
MQGTPYDFFVQWHLTERCNLRCRHCYQQRLTDEMSYDETCRALDNIKGAIEGWVTEYQLEMSPSLHFTGGEPFLRRDLFYILAYASKKGFSTSILSNGTLITDDTARRIKEAQVRDVQVSLDGLEAVHDSIRGKGSFRKALQGIENLLSNSIDTNVNLTVSRINVDQIQGLVRLASDMGVSAVAFARLVPCGRGEQLAADMLTPEELRLLYNNVSKMQASSKIVVTSRDPLASIPDMGEDIPQTEFPIGGCAAGVFGVTIAADGNIMPCRRMNMSVGNIREESFRKLWIESPVLSALRERSSYHGACGTCRYWPVCRGCRAVAIACTNSDGRSDYLGPDPQCPYYQTV